MYEIIRQIVDVNKEINFRFKIKCAQYEFAQMLFDINTEITKKKKIIISEAFKIENSLPEKPRKYVHRRIDIMEKI